MSYTSVEFLSDILNYFKQLNVSEPGKTIFVNYFMENFLKELTKYSIELADENNKNIHFVSPKVSYLDLALENKELKDELEILKGQIEYLDRWGNQNEEYITRLKAENKELKEDLEHYKILSETQSKINNDLQFKHSMGEGMKLFEYQSEIERLKEDLEHYKILSETQSKINEDKSNAIEILKKEYHSLKNKYSEVYNNLCNANDKISDLKEENNNLKFKLSSNEGVELFEYQAQIERLKEENTWWSERLDGARKIILDLGQKLNTSASENCEYKKDVIKDLQKKISHLNEKCEKYYEENCRWIKLNSELKAEIEMNKNTKEKVEFLRLYINEKLLGKHLYMDESLSVKQVGWIKLDEDIMSWGSK